MKNKKIQALTDIVEGKMTAIASTEAVDRSGDSIKVKDWDFKNFKKNPVLQAGHDYHPLSTIGIAKNIRIDGKKVLFEPVFHEITPLAREIKKMYEEKFLTAWSVGFIPAQEDGGTHELLEVSAVAVPANQEAITSLSQKSIDGGTKEEENKINEFIKKTIEKKKETVTKSPACKKEDETKDECTSRKIPELINEGMEQDQAVAAADNICSTSCKTKKKPKKSFIPRVNKQLPEYFDRVYTETKGLRQSTEMGLYKKHLGVEVKDIFINKFSIPMALIGSYLSAHENVFDVKPKETRKFNWDGKECPSVYADIQLNSTKRDSLLVDGIAFYDKKIAYKVYPTYSGMNMEVITSRDDEETNKKLMDEIHTWVKENNFLKGEKFSLTGEFLQLNKKSWSDLYINEKSEKVVKRAITMANKDDFASRGILMYGLPGNGKTLTGKIMMNEIKSSCIWVTAKDLANPWSTPSSMIASAYSLAKMLGTTVIFMEDIDAWLKSRTTDALKTEMDGLSENKGVLTVLTSNEPENLPDALLDRPGRFHDLLQYDAPSSSVRKKMLNSLLKREVKSIDKIIKKTRGYSGAYMKELVELALIISNEDEISIEKALYEALEKIETQKKLVEEIKKNKKEKEDESKVRELGISVKEGKVISKKNRSTIKKTVENLNNTVEALEKLLNISDSSKEPKEIDTPAKAIKNDKIKVVNNTTRKVHDEVKSQKELVVQILQQINKSSSYGLNKIKK